MPEEKQYTWFVIVWIITITIATGIFLLIVWYQHQVISLGYKLSKAQKQYQRLLNQRQALQTEIATFLAPDRLEKICRQRFNLTLPEKNQIIILRPKRK
jgi:cell division protein FtsL